MKNQDLVNGIPYGFMLLPALIFYGVFSISPLVFTGVYSFFDWRSNSSVLTFTGLANYASLLRDSVMLTGIKNSFLYAVSTVLLQAVIAVPVSVILNSKLPLRNAFRTLYFSPGVISTLVVGYLWSYILASGDKGMLNTLLKGFGLGPVNWLGDPKLALGSVILTQVWQWFGWGMIIYLGNLQSIPQELYEAADMDGCGVWSRFWRITVPQLTPALKLNLITGTISGLKVFDIIFSMTRGGPGHTTDTILFLMFTRFSDGNYGYAAAYGVVFLIFSMILAGVLLRLFKVWEDKLA
jgi:raffinose/stachyose/melibiose transport system permease protein